MESSVSGYRAPTGKQPGALGSFIGPSRIPVATPDVSALDFDRVSVNHGEERTLTVTNSGNLPLKIYRVDGEAATVVCAAQPCDTQSDMTAFSILEENRANGVVAVDAGCAITIQYAPTEIRPSSATLHLYTNSDYYGLLITVSGTAVPDDPVVPEPEVLSTASSAIEEDKGGGGAFGVMELFLLVSASLFRAGRIRRG